MSRRFPGSSPTGRGASTTPKRTSGRPSTSNRPTSDAAYYLGRLYADRKEWLNSGVYFAGAAFSLEDKEQGLEKKIEEIEASEMTPERKARLVVKKRVQILSVQATKATCQYNGAAGFHNAGSFERALDLARLAAAHPAFADKAAELIKLILDADGRCRDYSPALLPVGPNGV